MIEKLKKINEVCNYVGLTSLVIYVGLCLLYFISDSSVFLLARVFFASIALVAYSVRLGVEFSISIKKEETLWNKRIEASITLVILCMVDVIISAILLA